MNKTSISVETLLAAYQEGYFPMAESADSDTFDWIEPHHRGVIIPSDFHIPKRLNRAFRNSEITFKVNTDFEQVIEKCAEPQSGRASTWINQSIKTAYFELFKKGFCHTVECWLNNEMVGGLYGVHIAGAFFGESMFSRKTDASKMALIHLVARLSAGGFSILDTQFITDHLKQFGAIEMPQAHYLKLLDKALLNDGDYSAYDQLAPDT